MSYGISASSFFRGEDLLPKGDAKYGRFGPNGHRKGVGGFSRLKPVMAPEAPTTKIITWDPSGKPALSKCIAKSTLSLKQDESVVL